MSDDGSVLSCQVPRLGSWTRLWPPLLCFSAFKGSCSAIQPTASSAVDVGRLPPKVGTLAAESMASDPKSRDAPRSQIGPCVRLMKRMFLFPIFKGSLHTVSFRGDLLATRLKTSSSSVQNQHLKEIGWMLVLGLPGATAYDRGMVTHRHLTAVFGLQLSVSLRTTAQRQERDTLWPLSATMPASALVAKSSKLRAFVEGYRLGYPIAGILQIEAGGQSRHSCNQLAASFPRF